MNTPLNTPPPPISIENTSKSYLEKMVVSLSNSSPVGSSFNGTRTTHVMGNVSSNSNMIVDQQLSPDLSFFTDDFDPFTLHGQVYIYYCNLLNFLTLEENYGHSTERFKQKLVKIFPNLKNTCLRFVKADKVNKSIKARC